MVYVTNLRQVTSLPFRLPRQPFRQLSDNKDTDVTIALRTFRKGDRVRALIISRDLEKRQLSLGLKPSYFTGNESEVESDSEHLQDNELGIANHVETHGTLDENDSNEEHPHDSGSDEEEPLTDSDEHDDDDGDSITIQVDLAPPDPINSPKLLGRQDQDVHSLKVNGFQWFVNDTETYEESGLELESSDQSDGEVEKKKRKSARK